MNHWDIVKKKRIQMGVSQEFLSIRLGLSSPQFISNIERGKAHYPIKSLNTLAKVLKLNIKDLVNIKIQIYKEKIEKILCTQ